MAEEARDLIKMSDLARRSGVPASTIKHYLREGLLPEPARRTGRNMAYYDARIIPSIKTIKELQRTRFLPLKVIRQLLDGVDITDEGDKAVAAGIDVALRRHEAPAGSATAQELVDGGMSFEELDWMAGLGLLTPKGKGPTATYEGEDLGLCQTLVEARQAGLTPQMLPYTILGPYVEMLTELVRAELQMFRMGVMPRAGDDLQRLSQAATELSEQLILRMRRKLLLPTLEKIIADDDNV